MLEPMQASHRSAEECLNSSVSVILLIDAGKLMDDSIKRDIEGNYVVNWKTFRKKNIKDCWLRSSKLEPPLMA